MTEQESNQLRSPERGAFGFGMLFWALAGLIALNILVWREVFLPLLDWLGISWEIQTDIRGTALWAMDWASWVYVGVVIVGLLRLHGADDGPAWRATSKRMQWLFITPILIGLLIDATGDLYHNYMPPYGQFLLSQLLTLAGFLYVFCLLSLVRQCGERLGRESLVILAWRARKLYWAFACVFVAARVLLLCRYRLDGYSWSEWPTLMAVMGFVAVGEGAVFLVYLMRTLWTARRVCAEVAEQAGEPMSHAVEFKELLRSAGRAGLGILRYCREFGLVLESEDESSDPPQA